ncbi:MAG: hypothetical protein ABSB19_00480 [Methylomonas sp.]
MNNKFLIALVLISIPCAGFGADNAEPNSKTLISAMKKHLQQHGHFCLGKFDWPIDVSEAEFGMKTRDALQMPVLEKLGLVVSSPAEAMRKVDDAELSVPVKRYALTDAGKKFYLEKESVLLVGGKQVKHTHDFCVGKLSLDKVVNWTKKDNAHLTVSYTYKIAAAAWTYNPEAQKAFPLMAHIVNGEGKVKLEQPFRLVGGDWEALTRLD